MGVGILGPQLCSFFLQERHVFWLMRAPAEFGFEAAPDIRPLQALRPSTLLKRLPLKGRRTGAARTMKGKSLHPQRSIFAAPRGPWLLEVW